MDNFQNILVTFYYKGKAFKSAVEKFKFYTGGNFSSVHLCRYIKLETVMLANFDFMLTPEV